MQVCEAAWMRAMRTGDQDTAWAISDEVLRLRNPATRDDPALPYHQRWVWDGSAPEGRHVLVRCYHGLGDTLQFARFLMPLCGRAAQVTVEAQTALVPLLRTIEGVAVTAFDEAAPSPSGDCDVEIMELSHVLRLRPEAAPAPPYLRARGESRRSGIGLCWSAGGWDPRRSVPLEELGPILSSGRAVYSLVPDAGGGLFANSQGCPQRIEDTAALLASLDIIVTVDTMIAHLAGALGLPVFLLLHADADWRWGLRDRTPWYPQMRIFRQATQGDWTTAIQDAAACL